MTATEIETDDPADVLRQRDDVEAVMENDTTVYVWNNRSIGYSGDLNPSLLDLLAALSRAGHGVFPGPGTGQNPPTIGSLDREPDVTIHKDWSVRQRMNKKPEGQ